jgi:hypothetical protein
MSLNRSRSSRARSSQSRKGTQTGPSNSSSQTRPTTYSSKDPAFEQALIDAHIYPYGYEYSDDDDAPVPNDLDEINARLQQSRPSLSPSQFTVRDFQQFQKLNTRAKSEAAVMNNVFPMIMSKDKMPSGQDYPFNNLEPLASNISNPKPDYFNGSRPKEVLPKVRKDLGKHIIPSTDDSRPLLPNFFMEAKGPTGSAAEMKLQITQDLAAGARGIHKMQSYGRDESVFDGNAYSIGSTYHSGTGTLQLYAMHPTKPAEPNGPPDYHTTQIDTYGLTGNLNGSRQGIAAFRNAQDWAKERRDEFIALANEMAATHVQKQQEEEEEEEEEKEEAETEGTESEEVDESDYEKDESSSTMPSFAHRTERTISSLVGDDSDESETSLDELQSGPMVGRPIKRARASSDGRHGKRKARSRLFP